MKKLVYIVILSLLLLPGCAVLRKPAPTETPYETVDPYEGLVQVESGFGTKMWVVEQEGVPVSTLTAADFHDGEYTGDRYAVRRGIDVSEHQGEIDWAAVAESGVEFAVLRAGYRGYGEAGVLRRDEFFQYNVNGAAENGIEMGVYFFSQATSVEEAEEEADFLLDILSVYTVEAFALPVYFDWEAISQDTARTDGLDGETITDCAAAFCKKIADAGYAAGIYLYRNLGYFSYDLSRLTDYTLWVGAVGDWPDFYYAHTLWQYSYTGAVPGIAAATDLNLWFREPSEELADSADVTAGSETDEAADSGADEIVESEADGSADSEAPELIERDTDEK